MNPRLIALLAITLSTVTLSTVALPGQLRAETTAPAESAAASHTSEVAKTQPPQQGSSEMKETPQGEPKDSEMGDEDGAGEEYVED